MSEFDVTAESASEVLETLRERALMRILGAATFDWRDYLTDEEVADYDAAIGVEATQQLTPEPEPAVMGQTLVSLGRVLIEVYGGVAAVTQKPDNVEVEIIDHDNEA